MSERLRAILKLEVPIIVVIGRRQMPLREVVGLMPGTIIDLPKNADEELELLVNNKSVGTGMAMKVGENFGLRLSFIGNVRERIEAMVGVAEEKTAEDKAAEALAEQLLAGQM